jgi:hypothetical protein
VIHAATPNVLIDGSRPVPGLHLMKWYKMNIFKQIESELKLIIESKKQTGVFPVDVSAERVEATPPRDAAHGDIRGAGGRY